MTYFLLVARAANGLVIRAAVTSDPVEWENLQEKWTAQGMCVEPWRGVKAERVAEFAHNLLAGFEQ